MRPLQFLTSSAASLARKCFTLLLSTILFVAFPILLIASFPLYILRYVVSKTAKFIRPKLGQMVTTRGSIFATDDLHNLPKCNVIVAQTFQGNIDIDKARETIRQRLLAARLPNGNPKYPELKQYLSTWAGYYFWKDCRNFDLKNHVKIQETPSAESDRFSEEDIQSLRQEMVEKSWLKKQPLWDLTLLPNCYPKGVEDVGPHTTMILRFHHSLGDGYSFLSLLVEGLCKKPIKNATPNYVQRNPCAMFLYAIAFPFLLAYNAAEMLVISFLKLPFRVTSKMQTGRVNVNMSDRIPVSKIKEIKSHYKVSFSSVVFAALAGATRDIMIKKRMDIPSTLPSITALPIPGHSDKLRNYMTGGIINFPTGEADAIARLKFSQKDFLRIKFSTTPILMIYSLMFIGSYFSWITKIVGQNYMTSAGLSNFPGGFDYMSFNGHKCVDVMFTAGLQSGCTGLGFCALSYVDGFRISTMGDNSVLTKEDVKDLAVLVEKHIDILHQHVINDV